MFQIAKAVRIKGESFVAKAMETTSSQSF